MKRCSSSLVMKEVQIKNSMRYHYTFIIIALKGWQSWILKVWNTLSSQTLLVRMQSGPGILESSLSVSYKVQHALTM